MKNRRDVTSNAELRHILHYYDPISKPKQNYLSSIEKSVFAQLDLTPQMASPEGIVAPWSATGWTFRASALTLVLAIALGFVAGQLSYIASNHSIYAESPSLQLLADGQDFVQADSYGE